MPSVQTGILSVTFKNYGADSYYLSFGTGEVYLHKPFPQPDPNPFYTGTLSSNGPVTITGAFASSTDPNISRVYALKVCYHGRCSAPDVKHLVANLFDWGPFRVWGEKKGICPQGQKAFASFGCQDEDLVAYAPYENNVEMYLTDGVL